MAEGRTSAAGVSQQLAGNAGTVTRAMLRGGAARACAVPGPPRRDYVRLTPAATSWRLAALDRYDNGEHDEAFTRDLVWKRSSSLYSYERGNMDNTFYEISEDEANQIVERIRRTVSGEG